MSEHKTAHSPEPCTKHECPRCLELEAACAAMRKALQDVCNLVDPNLVVKDGLGSDLLAQLATKEAALEAADHILPHRPEQEALVRLSESITIDVPAQLMLDYMQAREKTR